MIQYCRYCVNCHSENGIFYCYNKMVILTEASIKRPNTCRHFLYSDSGDVVSGKQYKGMTDTRHKQMQMSFLTIMEELK